MKLLRRTPTRRNSRAISTVLVDICRGTSIHAGLAHECADDLVRAVGFHRIGPLARVALQRPAPQLAALLRNDGLRATMVHLQACAALQQLNAALPDIAWATFKGPVFSEHAHPLPGRRTYNDVDVLVAPSDLREVSRRLLTVGWRIADYEDMLRNTKVPGEMHWVSPSGAVIDLHWAMINMASRRRMFRVPTADLLRRRVEVTLGSQPAWTLEPVDSLIHACLHASLTGAHKLIYLIDVDQLCAKISDWDAVATRSREWQAQAQVSLVLMRASRLLGTELPPDIHQRLGIPRTLQGFVALSDLLAPVARVRDNTGVSKFVARAIQPTVPATVRVAGRNAIRGVKERLAGVQERFDKRVAADQASLDVYLNAVESLAELGQDR